MDAPDNPDPTLEAQEDVAEEQVLAKFQTRMEAAIGDDLIQQYQIVGRMIGNLGPHLTRDDAYDAFKLSQDLKLIEQGAASADSKGLLSGLIATPQTVLEQVHAWIQHAIQIKEAEVEQVADEHKDLLVQPEQDVARPAAEAPAPKRVIHDLTSLPSPHVTDDEEDLEQANREALNAIYGDSSSKAWDAPAPERARRGPTPEEDDSSDPEADERDRVARVAAKRTRVAAKHNKKRAHDINRFIRDLRSDIVKRFMTSAPVTDKEHESPNLKWKTPTVGRPGRRGGTRSATVTHDTLD